MIVVYPQLFFLPIIKDTDCNEDDLYRVLDNTEEERAQKDIIEEIDDEYVETETKKK